MLRENYKNVTKLPEQILCRLSKTGLHNKLLKLNIPKFYVGDKVLLRNTKAGKLDPLWVGLCVIVEVDPNRPNVVIEITNKKRVKVHVNSLKKYQSKEL
jgi:hypothetical protein